MEVGGCKVVFQRLETEAHFTNYKPQFLLQTLEETQADRIFYFDPDIVVEARWGFFEEWADAGVALAEDVNSPLPENHPRRVAWRNRFKEVGIDLKYRQAAYVNGGFIGMRREFRVFAERWCELLTKIIGWEAGDRGWNHTTVSGGRISQELGTFAHSFSIPDQDSLNGAVEACAQLPISVIGQEAMGFKVGGYIMYHALGPRKPWRRRYVSDALGGSPPARVDKLFWHFLEQGPIKPLPLSVVKSKQRQVKLAAAIGRFIRRS
jgi:hypothetical protein